MKPEIEALRAEAAGPAAELAAEPETVAAPEAGVVLVARSATRAIGNVICQRCGVPLLNDLEAQAVGDAIADLLRVYDLTNMDPRTAAWLGFGTALFAVSMPRVAMVQSRPRREAPKPEPVSEPAKAEPEVAPAPVNDAERDGRAFHNAPA